MRSRLAIRCIAAVAVLCAQAHAAQWVRTTPAPAHGAVSAVALVPSDVAVIYAGTVDGEILRSSDAGSTWTVVDQTAKSQNRGVRSLLVHPADPDVLYRSMSEGFPHPRAAVSHDGGASWDEFRIQDPILASDSSGLILSVSEISFDAGATWQSPTGTRGRFDAAWIHPGRPEIAMLGGFRTEDGGRTWTLKLSTATEVAGFAHAADDAERLYAATRGGVRRSLDAGVTWDLSTTGSGVTSVGVAPGAPQVYAVRQVEGAGRLLRSNDRGDTWLDISEPLLASTYATDGPIQVEVFSADHLLVRTQLPHEDERYELRGRGFLYESRDGGTSWKRLGIGILDRPEMEQIEWGWDGGERVWFAGSTAGLFRRTDSDTTWTQLQREPSSPFSVGRRRGEVVVILTDTGDPDVGGTVRVSRDGGTTWTNDQLPGPAWGRPVSATDDDDIIYLSGTERLIASSNGGRDWQRRGFLGFGDLWVSPFDADLLLTRPDRRSTVRRSIDGGVTWSDVDGLDSLNAFVVAASPTDSRLLYAAYRELSQGLEWYPQAPQSLYRSTDKGLHWETIRATAGVGDFEKDLAIYPDAPEVLLTAGRNDVLLSRDGGWVWESAADEPVGDRMLTVLVDDGPSGRLLAASERGIYTLQLSGPPSTVARSEAASYDTAVAAGSWAHPVQLRNVRSLAVAADGRVWFVGQQDRRDLQVGYVRGDSVVFPEVGDDVATRFKARLAVDAIGGVWCGSAWFDGARWIDRTPSNADEMTNVYGNNLEAMHVRNDGEVWGRVIDDCHGFDGTLAIFGGDVGHRGEWRFGDVLKQAIPGWQYINAIVEGNGSLWIGSGADHCMQSSSIGGLTQYDGERWRLFGVQQGLPHPYVQDIALSADGSVWTVGKGGVARFEAPYERGAAFTDSNSALPSRRATAVAVDDSGAVWITTDAGLSRFFDDYWTNYNETNGLADNDATDVVVGPAGRVWVATEAGVSVLTRTPTAPVRSTQVPPVDTDPAVPVTFELGPNYPNPFNPGTTIPFVLDESSEVSVTIYNMSGQAVRTLLSEVRPIGAHQVDWDGADDAGAQVASGVYLYRLHSGTGERVRRMVLIR